MENTQITNSDNTVVQNSKEEVLMETENSNVGNQVDFEIKKETPLNLVKKIIPLAQRGYEITVNNNELYPLFLEIYVLSNRQLLPIVEKLSDFETLTDELKKQEIGLLKLLIIPIKVFN